MSENELRPLVTQNSAGPTRKLMAMIISGAILGAGQTALRIIWPDNPFAPFLADVDIWLQGAIMIMFGYFTRNRESVDVAKLKSTIKQMDSTSS